MSTKAQSERKNKPEAAQEHQLLHRIKESDTLNQTVECVRSSIRANPETAALWCLGIGFVLGWKMKPW